MKKEMLINVMQPEECRIAIVEDGVLQELYVERMNQESYVNNIYKGKVVNLEPSIQAAFVDFGIGRNGFLHVSDVASAYFRSGERSERGGSGERRDDRGGGGRHGERPPSRRFEPVEIPSGPAPIEEAVPPEFAEEAPAVEEEYYDDGFGAGLDFEDTPHAGTIIAAPGVDVGEVEEDIIAEIIDSPPANELDVKWDSDADSDSETDEASESGEPAEEGGEKPKRRRSAKGKPRRPGDPKAAKKKPVKKKPDDDDKPKYQGSAEHRTTIDDEFFFDPSGPNDRFADESQPAAQGDEAPADFAPDEPSQEPESAEFSDPDAGLANNFAAPEDQWEDGPPPSYNRDRDRGGRDDRGGRGGRDDRGGRGGRGGRDGRGDRGGRGGRDGRSGSDTERRSGSGGGGFGRGRDGGMRPPPIESIFKRGQEVIVQVIKEGMGTKGPTLSTHISIAGRYLVLAPWLNRVAVSRKITDEGTRHRLKEIMAELNAPKGVGFIIRTAAVDRNVQELQSDLAYLVRLWEVFCNRVVKRPGPSEIYRESDMVTRTIRDMFANDIDAIYVDEPEAFSQAQEFMNIVMPRFADRLKLHDSSEPLFHHFKIENEVAKLQDKKVPLPGGGSLIIEQTEALVAIDVNSGNFRVGDDAEETAYQTNLQAAKEISRQLRLRNLGGVIINDFIDMKDERHRRNLEETFRKSLKRDRSRTKILKTSAFGVIEMTRQRVQTSLKRTAYQECTHCRGTGLVKTPLSMSIDIMRMIQLAAFRKQAKTVEVHVHTDVANHLLNKKRRDISKWEDEAAMTVSINARLSVSPEFIEFRGLDNNGHDVNITTAPPPPAARAPERRDDRPPRGGGGGAGGGGRGGRGGGGGRGRR